MSSSGIVVAVNDEVPRTPLPNATQQVPANGGLPFDEETKLVYGVVLSLRNMIKKVSGKYGHFHLLVYDMIRLNIAPYRDEGFVNYRTSTYKLHLYETLSGYKFIMLSDPNADSLRFVMRQIYAGPFLEYVVRNPIAQMDSKEHGIDNEYFRTSIDRMIRGLSVFN